MMEIFLSRFRRNPFPLVSHTWMDLTVMFIESYRSIKSRRMIRKTAQCSGTALGWMITRSVQKCPESVIPGPFLRLEGNSQKNDPGNRTTKCSGSMPLLNS
jgi:hypothetical protein